MPDEHRTKLDPILSELVDRAARSLAAQPAEPVTVLVSLRERCDDRVREELEAAGLTVRSVVGDIVTGVVAVADLPRLALVPAVHTIEGGRPMEPEGPMQPE
jgi:hypothetical protein